MKTSDRLDKDSCSSKARKISYIFIIIIFINFFSSKNSLLNYSKYMHEKKEEKKFSLGWRDSRTEKTLLID